VESVPPANLNLRGVLIGTDGNRWETLQSLTKWMTRNKSSSTRSSSSNRANPEALLPSEFPNDFHEAYDNVQKPSHKE
jgi:hypothetical protein